MLLGGHLVDSVSYKVQRSEDITSHSYSEQVAHRVVGLALTGDRYFMYSPVTAKLVIPTMPGQAENGSNHDRRFKFKQQ